LFADISKMIFSIINEYYNEASETPLNTGQLFLISPRQVNTLGINTPSFDTVTITHPFHPHFKMQFQIISIQQCWGEGRVRYRDEKGAIRSVPISWTD
jgi:hypothetical protein